MAGVTGTSQLDQTVNAVRAKAIFTMQDYGVFPGAVDRAEVPAGNRSFTEPKISAVTAYDLTEGLDMAQAQQLSDTLITITPTEVGVQVIYTKLAQKTRSESVVNLISRAITDALKKKQDTDGTAQMDNFAVAFGGSGKTLTRGYISAAIAQVRGNTTEISKEQLYCAVHPFTFNDLVDQLTEGLSLSNAGVPSSLLEIGAAGTVVGHQRTHLDLIQRYGVGSLHGVPILTDANFAIASSLAKGGVFTKRAVVYAELWGVDVEPEKDGSLRGTEMNGTMCYAYGERTDTWGVELNMGAASPTY